MKKLIIKFWQNENVVMMKVLEQDERLRNKGKIFKDKNLDMAICSTRFPKIFPTSIFIRGGEKGKDNLVDCFSFDSIKDATIYIERCQELISDYNIKLEDNEEEEVETIKTFIFK